MKVPVDSYEDTLTILRLQNFSRVFELFDFSGRKSIALFIAQTIVDKEAYILSADEVNSSKFPNGSCVVSYPPSLAPLPFLVSNVSGEPAKRGVGTCVMVVVFFS